MTATTGKKPRAESSSDSPAGAGDIKIPLRKLVIVPISDPVPHPSLDSFFSQEWNNWIQPMVVAVLRNDLSKIHNKREFFYRKIESLVNCGFSSDLCDRLRTEIHSHCQTMFMRSPRNRVHDTANSILGLFENFSSSIDLIVRIFNALDRLLIWQNTSPDITTMAFSVWRDLLCEAGLAGIVVQEILSVTDSLRSKFLSNEIATEETIQFLHSLVSMNVRIGTFDSHLVGPVLQQTKDWYNRVGSELASSLSVDEYARIVHSLFHQEKELMDSSGFPPTTWRTIDHDILRPELVMKNFPTLIERDLARVMTAATNSLGQIFDLCNKFPEKILSESVLKFTFGESVKSLAKSAITHESKSEREIIPNLISVCEKISRILDSSFAGKPTFVASFKDSMETVVNHVTSHIPMLLADYMDDCMWSGVIERVEDPIDPSTTWLPSALSIFKFLASKDLFEVHHRNFLAKRLIYLGSNYETHATGINFETAVIALLKAECGAGYTNKMEGMVKDVLASEDFMEQQVKKNDRGIVWKCTVITTGVWPSNIVPSDPVIVPKSIQEYEKNFVDIYKKNFPKKSVKFVHNLSSCLVRFHRKYDLVCSGPQALILNLFNEDMDSMSVDVIAQETRIAVNDLEKAIKPLVDAGLVIALNGMFEINMSWRPKDDSGPTVFNQYQYRRELEGGPLLMSETERLQTESSVAEDRQHQLDALIVRLMKKSRTAALGQLLREITSNLPASLATYYRQTELKKRIDSLVDREFLEKVSTIGDPDNVEIRYLI